MKPCMNGTSNYIMRRSAFRATMASVISSCSIVGRDGDVDPSMASDLPR